MNKKVIVHVGPPKTGTSVLQNWFNNNRDLLSQHGVFYPTHTVDANGVSSGNKNEVLDVDEAGVTTFSASKYCNLLSEFTKSHFNTLLLSSEYFFSSIPEFIASTTTVELQIVAYIRPDFEFVESIYNQAVKRNHQTNKIDLNRNIPFGYLDRLIDYIDKFGAGKFHLRAYGVGDFFTHGIVSDFCSQLNISDDLTKQSSDIINNSYSFECLEFKRWTNRFSLGALEYQLDNYLQAYSKNSSRFTILPYNTYMLYKRQSFDKIECLNRIGEIHNFSRLKEYMEADNRAPYLHQELYPSHIKLVVKYILNKDYNFLLGLVSTLKNQALEEYDRSNVKVIETVIENEGRSKEVPSKPSIRFVGYLAQFFDRFRK